MASIRSFIAVPLPETVKTSLSEVQDRLKSWTRSNTIKWIAVESIHITLHFLGNIDETKIDPITTAITAAASGVAPFKLEVKGLGAFPNLRRVGVVWVGVTGDTECLSRLQKQIGESLKPLGFVPESRPFTPHLTLARVREEASLDERQALGKMVSETVFNPGNSFAVDAVYLMRSQLTPTGAIYTPLSTVRL